MPRPFICHTCGADLEVSPKCDCDKELTMTDKMPDVIYAERTMSMGSQVVGKFASESAMKAGPDSTCTKYISEQKHAEEIAALKKEEIVKANKIINEVLDLLDDKTRNYAMELIKQRISE